MVQSQFTSLLAVSILAVSVPAHAAAMSATLTSSIPSPIPLGAMTTWTASVSDAASGTLWYRFRARKLGADYRVIRDYGPEASLDWTASEHDGAYEIEVSVKNQETSEHAAASSLVQVQSRVLDGKAAVNPTSHPLVFLYSAPSCRTGERIRVQYQAGDGDARLTPYQSCAAGLSMNFYLAGMYPNAAYTAHQIVDTGSQFVTGPDLSFTTGDAPPDLFTETVVKQPPAAVSNQILLGSSFNGPVATDLSGNLLWYCPGDISFITRPDPGGYFWGIREDGSLDTSQQIIRKFDLVGMTILETNAARVNEQLASMGRRPIAAFHHEVRTLPDGRIAALADVEQMLTGVQGPDAVDVIGDMIIVFDRDLNVVWTWDAFDHLDVTRMAVMGETCSNASACPPFYLAEDAHDWTHGNSVQQTPDGNLLYSSRHQDWLIKIDYNNGEGSGGVIWRLGQDGDFQVASADPSPWFSHQHDGNIELSDPSLLLVFDDGNTRVKNTGGGNSRGQVLQLDEQKRMATLVLNADLGVYSIAVGSAQRLRDGNYHFDAGFVLGPDGTSSYSIEVDGSGNIVYGAKANTILYRSFRMTDMYTPN
jgi:arylsulfate sulfotransferase